MDLKTQFIEFALECNALQFGEFTLKSGRVSPYFFNAGLFYHGNTLQKLGYFYAQTLLQNAVVFEHLFGPAYKGIGLATTTAIALANANVNVTVTFNRKEVKHHGEGGELIGAPLTGKTIMIDDVITAGTAFRESQKLISHHGGKLSAVIIALDRCERGLSSQSAIHEIRNQGIDVFSIVNLFDLMDYLSKTNQHQQLSQIQAYQELYGQ